MTTYCIIDVDTTLANGDHRAALLVKDDSGQVTQESWDAFLRPDLMALDEPQQHALDVINQLRQHNHQIVFLTGRQEKFRLITEAWLAKHMGFWHHDRLVMRQASQAGMPASECKESAFLDFMRSEYLLHGIRSAELDFLFFEDDKHVMKMWRKYGLVFQCPEAWAFMNPEVPTEKEKAWTR